MNPYHIHLYKLRAGVPAVANMATNRLSVNAKRVNHKVNGSLQQIQTKRATLNDQDSITTATQSTSESNTNSTIISKLSSKKIAWSNLHYNLRNNSLYKNNALQDLVLLDSDSTNTMFCNENYVNNIKNTEIPLEIQTNGGTMRYTLTCYIPGCSRYSLE